MHNAKLKTGDDQVILDRGVEVIRLAADALELLAQSLDSAFVQACRLIHGASGRIVTTGMGKSGHISRKFAATLSATGTPALYVDPAEAAHGDLGMLVLGDVLVIISNSGKTAELRPLISHAKEVGIEVIGITSRPGSLVMIGTDIWLRLPVVRETCPFNIAPTTSTSMQLALCDAIAMAVMDIRGLPLAHVKALHPGGNIGLRLTAIRELMHGSDKMPIVSTDLPMADVIACMSDKGFGITGVVDDRRRLVGVISDGDLRRHFTEKGDLLARDVMTSHPRLLPADTLAEDALRFLNEQKITCAFVIDKGVPSPNAFPIGIIHMHDFLGFGLS